uniref:Uncharacterized protein n=1 Tax=Lepeophtheirus salmonis TaxID=72036 RepID=A0A0K2TJ22_LEPSM
MSYISLSCHNYYFTIGYYRYTFTKSMESQNKIVLSKFKEGLVGYDIFLTLDQGSPSFFLLRALNERMTSVSRIIILFCHL